MRNAGALRNRVVLQSVSYSASTQSSQGVASFSTLATVWAAVRPLGGSEGLQGPSITSVLQYEIEMRFRTDVTPRMRVLYTPYSGSAKTLEVLAVAVHPRSSDRVVLTCGETP